MTNKNKTYTGVIGAGFGRTGTDSLREALIELGYGPVLHMIEIMPRYFKVGKYWKQLAQTKDKEERKKILKLAVDGYNSFCDFPVSIYFEELMEMYPDKLVVLTIRETGLQWAKSYMTTIGSLGPKYYHNHTLGFKLFIQINPIGRLMGGLSKDFGLYSHVSENFDEISLAESHDNWIKYVKSKVPNDKLVIMKPGDGWEPLIKGLNISMPTTPYPNVNDNKTMQIRIFIFSIIGWLTLFFYLYIFYKVIKRVFLK
jgi:hypothetical protein